MTAVGRGLGEVRSGGEEAEARNTGEWVVSRTQETVDCAIFQEEPGAGLVILHKQRGNFCLDPSALFDCPMCTDEQTP